MEKKFLIFGVLLGSFAFSSQVFANQASAIISATQADSKVAGEATLTEKDNGLEIEVKVENLSPGKHGIHIHENGDCGEAGKAAGSHYNPDNVSHGFVVKDGFEHAHAGDFGNIEVGEDGKGTTKFFVPGLTLTGQQHNVSGKAIILHEKEDDFGQPTGNAGGRIGCGVIMMKDIGDQASEDNQDTITKN